MEPVRVRFNDIEAAVPVIREVALLTPILPLGSEAEGTLYLKLENLQRLGSFKIRGAWNRISRFTSAERARGVATFSAGNHGLAVAWCCRRLGLPCRVMVLEDAVPRKVEAIRSYGVIVEQLPMEKAIPLFVEERWRELPEVFVSPFADPYVIAGQGTIGIEVVRDLPDVRTVLIPVGGGGLAAGIAIAVKRLSPKARVFGVQADGAAPLPKALAERKTVFLDAPPHTIADAIRVGGMLGNMAELLSGLLDGALTVSDEEIKAAMRRLAFDAKVVAEPASAAAVAAWGRYGGDLEPPAVAIVSGGNVDQALLKDVLTQDDGLPSKDR